tara:strand:- start:9985 stop:10302 length:318 start_codon:yes stop_codon:yes gene_type:complete
MNKLEFRIHVDEENYDDWYERTSIGSCEVLKDIEYNLEMIDVISIPKLLNESFEDYQKRAFTVYDHTRCFYREDNPIPMFFELRLYDQETADYLDWDMAENKPSN